MGVPPNHLFSRIFREIKHHFLVYPHGYGNPHITESGWETGYYTYSQTPTIINDATDGKWMDQAGCPSRSRGATDGVQLPRYQRIAVAMKVR